MKAQALSVLRPSPATNNNSKNVNTSTTNSKKSSLLLKVLADSGFIIYSVTCRLRPSPSHFLANRHAKKDTIKIMDAGGGPGYQNLNYSELQEGQKLMYKRTLDDPPILQDNRSQETRLLAYSLALTLIHLLIRSIKTT